MYSMLRSTMFHRSHFLFGALGIALLCAGCDSKDGEIKVYRIAKADAEEPGAPAGMPVGPAALQPGGPQTGMTRGGPGAAMAPAATDLKIAGTAPASWVAQPASAMRLASYQIKGDNGAEADVSVIALGGAAGGVLENVNRWLGQLGKSPIAEAELTSMAQHLTTPLGDVAVVDLEGLPAGADPAKDGRIVAAIVSLGDRTLFFKLRGNANLVESRKLEFMKWLETVRLSAK